MPFGDCVVIFFLVIGAVFVYFISMFTVAIAVYGRVPSQFDDAG